MLNRYWFGFFLLPDNLVDNLTLRPCERLVRILLHLVPEFAVVSCVHDRTLSNIETGVISASLTDVVVALFLLIHPI